MNELELRKYANCSMCGRPVGHTKLPLFSRVTVERIGINMDAVKRQTGLAQFLGGNAEIARVMGSDEEMTESIGGVVTLSICEHCYLKPVMIAQLAELPDLLDRAVECTSCKARIIFLTTNTGKQMPVDADSVMTGDTVYEHGRHVSHFSTCTDPDKHRKPR